MEKMTEEQVARELARKKQMKESLKLIVHEDASEKDRKHIESADKGIHRDC